MMEIPDGWSEFYGRTDGSQIRIVSRKLRIAQAAAGSKYGIPWENVQEEVWPDLPVTVSFNAVTFEEEAVTDDGQE